MPIFATGWEVEVTGALNSTVTDSPAEKQRPTEDVVMRLKRKKENAIRARVGGGGGGLISTFWFAEKTRVREILLVLNHAVTVGPCPARSFSAPVFMGGVVARRGGRVERTP